MKRKTQEDREFDVAIALLEAVLGAQVIPSVPCEYGDCGQAATLYRNGSWCKLHVVKMERRTV